MVSLDSTLVEGQKWLQKNQKKNLIDFYFSNYNNQEESDFFDFAKWIKTMIQDLLTKQKNEQENYLTLGLEKNNTEKKINWTQK